MLYRKNKNSGAVLLTVIVLSMVLSFVVIAIMSSSVSQVKSSQGVIDDTKAEYLSQAFFYQYHQQMMNAENDALPDGSSPNQIGLKNFTPDSSAPTPAINDML